MSGNVTYTLTASELERLVFLGITWMSHMTRKGLQSHLGGRWGGHCRAPEPFAPHRMQPAAAGGRAQPLRLCPLRTSLCISLAPPTAIKKIKGTSYQRILVSVFLIWKSWKVALSWLKEEEIAPRGPSDSPSYSASMATATVLPRRE